MVDAVEALKASLAYVSSVKSVVALTTLACVVVGAVYLHVALQGWPRWFLRLLRALRLRGAPRTRARDYAARGGEAALERDLQDACSRCRFGAGSEAARAAALDAADGGEAMLAVSAALAEGEDDLAAGAKTAYAALQLLATLTDATSGLAQPLARMGAGEAALAAMRRHAGATQPEVALAGSSLIANLVDMAAVAPGDDAGERDGTRDALVAGGALELLAEVLRDHRDHEWVCLMACDALRGLVDYDGLVSALGRRAGVLSDIADKAGGGGAAAARNGTELDSAGKEAGMAASAMRARERRSRAVSSGVLAGAAGALLAHLCSEATAMQIVRAFAAAADLAGNGEGDALCSEDESSMIRGALISSGAARAISLAVLVHAQLRGAAEFGGELLFFLARGSDVQRADLVETGACEALLAARYFALQRAEAALLREEARRKAAGKALPVPAAAGEVEVPAQARRYQLALEALASRAAGGPNKTLDRTLAAVASELETDDPEHVILTWRKKALGEDTAEDK